MSGSKQARRSNTAVQKRGLSKRSRCWAGETVLLARLANIFDVVESPALDEDDNKAGDRGGGGLSEEHDSGRDLHIMTKFQVTREVEGLFRHDHAINLENHDGNGPSGNDIAGDEFRKDVESHLLVGNRKENAKGEGEDQRKDDSEDVSPERHIRVVNLDGNGSEDESSDKKGAEPPVGNIAVARHETGVNVLLVLDAGAKLPLDVTPVPQVGVGDDGGESGEAQTIVHHECRREEDGGVVAVLLHIEETVRNDLHGIVRLAGVRVSLSGGDREVGGIPGVREVDDRDDEPKPEEERNHGVQLGPPLKRW